MRTQPLAVSLIALLALAPIAAQAQSQDASSDSASSSSSASGTAPPPKDAARTAPSDQKPDSQSSEGATVVTVTAQKPLIQHKIDRDVYDVTQDPQAATGAASDVLNNVPGVTVDNDGTVSLRGNSGVQVYVNGKKSAQMQGDERAFTLQSLPADDIDSVEVIPNPGAAYGADTAGGIINIVMKRGRSLKPHTMVNVTLGTQGRNGVNFRTGKTIGKLRLNGGVNIGSGRGGGGRGGGGGGSTGGSRKSVSDSDIYTLDPTSGAVVRENAQHRVTHSKNESVSANMSAEYDIDDSSDLTADLSYSRRRSTSDDSTQTQTYDAAHGLVSDITRLSNSSAPVENMDARLTYDHRGQVGSTEDFKMALSHSSNLSQGVTYTRNIDNTATTADTFTTRARKSKTSIDEFSGDWSHPLGDYDKTQQQIQLGWDVQHNVSDSYNYQSLTLDHPVDPPQSPRASSVTQFNDDQVLSAAYATYQRQFGRLSFQAGLRVENLHEKIVSDNPVQATSHGWSRDSLDYAPNLFFMYKLDPDGKTTLKMLYSRKIQRPQGSQLDPQIVYSEDGLNARSGNINLHSATTDKYDFDINHDGTLFDWQGQFYYNATSGNFEQVQQALPGQPNVILTTYENSGNKRNYGFSGNINFHSADPKLRLSLSPNIGYTVTDYIDFSTHLPKRAQGPNSSLNGRVMYRLTGKDNLIFGVQYRGKTVDVQNYRTAQQAVQLSWMHQIIQNKFVLIANLSNVVLGPVSKSVQDSSVAYGWSRAENPGATFMVSLRYMFGQPLQRGGFRGRPDGPPPGGWRGRGGDGPGGEGGPPDGGPGGGPGGF
jgi:outer membrane cobalamin receptor